MPNLSGLPIHQTPLMLRLTTMAHANHPDQALKPALRKVCDYLLRNPLSSATMTIDTIAARAHSSTAAVNRLANKMGMNGFTGLHNALVDNLLGMLAPQEQVHSEQLRKASGAFSLEHQVNLSKSNLDGVLSLNAHEMFETAVRQVIKARHIYIVGFGNSFYLAGLAAASLSVACASATALNVEGGAEIAAYRLAGISADDLLVAIALPPYSSETLMLAKWAKTQEAKVIGLTDSPASPLCEHAQFSLFAPPAHPILPNSKAGLLSLIEAVVAIVAQRNAVQVASNRQAVTTVFNPEVQMLNRVQTHTPDFAIDPMLAAAALCADLDNILD